MDLLWMCVGVLMFGVVVAVLKKICLAVALRFGWRPRILDEQQMANTVKSCTDQFVKECSQIRKDQGCEVTDDEKRMMREDIEKYTKFVILRYVDNYVLAR
jgi:hypothetical protein